MRVEPSAAVPGRVRLAPGRHDSPREGACVVELASLFGGEEFSDRPQCVCPVVGAFLRAWNDRAAYADRERLRPYAARIVGTRGPSTLTRRRRDMCLSWAGADPRGGRLRRALARTRLRVVIAIVCGPRCALRLHEGAAEYAARALYGRRDVDGAFALLESMLSVGPQGIAAAAGLNGAGPVGQGPGTARVNGHRNGHDGSAVAQPERVSVGD